MATVHLFASARGFADHQSLRDFVDATYTEDGDLIPSAFMREVELHHHAPACIEIIHAGGEQPLRRLLDGVSYAEQWAPLVPSMVASAAVCVFEPNRLERPEGAGALSFVGAFTYDESPSVEAG